MRAMHDRVSLPNATTGELEPHRHGHLAPGQVRGNNNGNHKGGTYYQNQMGVLQITKQAPKYVMPLTDMSALVPSRCPGRGVSQRPTPGPGAARCRR